MKEELNNIGGWLLFLIILLVFLSPLSGLYLAITEGYTSLDLYNILGLVVLFILTGIFLWQKKPFAVKFAKIIFITALLSNILYLLLNYGGIRYLLRSSVYALIWILYLYKSKRVQVVYGKLKEKTSGYQIWSIVAIIFSFVTPIYGGVFSVISLINISKNRKLKGMVLSVIALVVSIIFLLLTLGSDYVPEDIEISCSNYCYEYDGATHYIVEYDYDSESYICYCKDAEYGNVVTQKSYSYVLDDETIVEEEDTSNEIEEQTTTIVSYVLDGDTIKLSNGETVRLIGINAPEEGEKCYEEAKEFLEGLILGKEVILEKDVEDKDQYGRLLRYVYTDYSFEEGGHVDDFFINYGMIYLGYAHKYEYGLNTKYSAQFEQAESEAKENEGCLWKSEEINYVQDKCIYIKNFHFNAAGNDNYNLNDEYVVFRNKCSYSINMGGWTVKDETASHIYTIPSFTFQSGATFTLYTGTGTNTNSALYWGRTSGDYAAIWNNGGDTIFLRDSNGNLVLSQSYSGY